MAKPANPFWKVREIISLFIQMGCDHHVVEPMEDHDGESFGVRYLHNSDTNGFVVITDLADEDSMSPWEVATWERRLGIIIPKKPAP